MTITSTQSRSVRAAANSPLSHLQQEYDSWQALLEAQSPIVQRFIEAQARALADALVQHLPQARFTLPDRVVTTLPPAGETAQPAPVPGEFREQMAGGLVDRLTRTEIDSALRQRLSELAQSPNRAVAIAASLLRHATAVYMIRGLLPSGRSVVYTAVEDEEIPTVPTGDLGPESAITAATDAIAEDGQAESDRGELLVPYVPAARRFYLPQWVAFDDDGQLLVNSANDAEAHLASMQRFVAVLHAAVSLTPYVVADAEYQQKRYGMLGQLVNQGRALALYETREIVQAIKRRAAAHDLNRGLNLSLPYFDDQLLKVQMRNFEVIPAGRIMFLPAFVVRAAREEQVKVAQDTRLNPSTRKYLLRSLKILEGAFESL